MIDKKQPKKILLKKGRIIDPFSKKTFIGDILIENGKIASIKKNITSKDKNILAATPPLEAQKLLFSMAVTEGIGYEAG